MNSITEQLLSVVSDWDGSYKGAYNIREDGGCAGRQSSENIKIEPKKIKFIYKSCIGKNISFPKNIPINIIKISAILPVNK